MTNFFSLYFLSFTHPSIAFTEILKHKKKLLYGLMAFLVPATGYTLFYLMAYSAGGSPSTFKPWLALPIEKYFFYDIFLTIPGYFVSFLVASSLVYLLSKVLGGKGTFDDTFTLLGFSVGIASWSSMVHDLTDAFLSFIGVLDMRWYEQALNSPTIWRTIWLAFYTGYFIWFPILFTKGIHQAQKLSLGKSVILSLIGFLVFQVILLIFIR